MVLCHFPSHCCSPLDLLLSFALLCSAVLPVSSHVSPFLWLVLYWLYQYFLRTYHSAVSYIPGIGMCFRRASSYIHIYPITCTAVMTIACDYVPMTMPSCLCLPVFGDIIAELVWIEQFCTPVGCKVSVDMRTLVCSGALWCAVCYRIEIAAWSLRNFTGKTCRNLDDSINKYTLGHTTPTRMYVRKVKNQPGSVRGRKWLLISHLTWWGNKALMRTDLPLGIPVPLGEHPPFKVISPYPQPPATRCNRTSTSGYERTNCNVRRFMPRVLLLYSRAINMNTIDSLAGQII